MTTNYDPNYYSYIRLAHYSLDYTRNSLPFSCGKTNLLIDTIKLDINLNYANDALVKYKDGIDSGLPTIDLNALKTTLIYELKSLLEGTEDMKPYFEDYPSSFGWSWINSFETRLDGFQVAFSSSAMPNDYEFRINELQESLSIAEIGVHAHIDSKDLSILGDEVREVNKSIVNYLSDSPSSELLANLTKNISNIQSQANTLMMQLADESNYYKLLANFSELSTSDMPELQTKLIILQGSVDERLEYMDLVGLLDKCTSDIIELL